LTIDAPPRVSGAWCPIVGYDVRMDASEAARALNAARWGTSRLDGMIHELRDRAGELGAEQVAELRTLVDEVNTTKEND
jgi:hypothetical protein